MNTKKLENNNVKMIAHRGLSGLEPENTCSAFVAAANRSYYGIETDIRKTADGKIVINHDADLFRVAGEKILVEEVSLSTVQSVVHFDKDGKKDRNDLISPTLKDYISICKRYEKHAVIEMKSDFTDEDVSQIIEIISAFDYLPNVTFISFKYDNLLRVRKILPDQSVQFLFSRITDDIIEMLVKDRIDVDVEFSALTDEYVKIFHNAGLKVNCWTVDEITDAQKLLGMGVDFMTSNIIE